jgi:3-oxoacyl-[acyl-carrier protein] reductase
LVRKLGFIQGDWLTEGLGKEAYEKSKEYLESRAPLQLTCSAETVAESILQFVEGHSVITGQYVVLDGGNHLI